MYKQVLLLQLIFYNIYIIPLLQGSWWRCKKMWKWMKKLRNFLTCVSTYLFQNGGYTQYYPGERPQIDSKRCLKWLQPCWLTRSEKLVAQPPVSHLLSFSTTILWDVMYPSSGQFESRRGLNSCAVFTKNDYLITRNNLNKSCFKDSDVDSWLCKYMSDWWYQIQNI